ncbi:glycosyltransferase family 4 protein [Aquihabitans sp. G128]|uniref:glycosyltransferase family 4 protein n=1 Tax=Aquihabitans sp. G128 TaxID=2849779 RepID=UPI001C24FC10|nr:glycosyltransferase family 4 protein [Aquihabitans sp. G128]QXC60264.1 glycosyltransferase family 4 protein [Aquihabitans sp. G128]
MRAPRAPGVPLRLVVVARLQPAKGIEDALAALAIVRAGGTDARLRIVGDGPHRDALRLRVARTGLGDHVDLVGPLAPEAVRAELAAADAFVSPSLSEGISNGVLEAMATGVAVISTEVGGMAEVVTDGVDGRLVPAGRPDRLAAALLEVLGDEGARRDLAAAGRERVEAAFGRSRQRAEWLAVYDELAMEARRSASSSVDRSEGTT